jgi:TonB-dependent receptor
MRIKNNPLAAAIALLISGGAVAQEQAIEEVIVTANPIRDSQGAAIEAKRAAVNVSDVIAADTIGRFPDQNLADSLGRVPGVAIERDQGQARFINFRGTPFRYTKIAFDGIDVLGAENGRVPRFDSFPSTITSRIEVNKAITADMPGESVIGYVNINTFNPFDQVGFRISAEAGAGNQELGDQDIDRYNLRTSFSNETFGVLGFYSHNQRGRITDNREMGYELTPQGLVPSVDDLDFRSYRGLREDNAYGGQIEFRPTGDSRIFLSTLYSEFIDEEERNQYEFGFDALARDGVELTPNTGYYPEVGVRRLLEDGTYENSTFTNTLGADFRVGEWDIEARYNYTETENTTDLPLPDSRGAVVAASYDLSDPELPVVEVFARNTMTPIDVNTLDYAFTLALYFQRELETDANKFKFDAGREIDFMGDSYLKLGFQYDTREAEGGSGFSAGAFPDSVDPSDFVTNDLWDAFFPNTIGGRNIDNAGLEAAWVASGRVNPPNDPDENIGIDEDVLAVYAMNTTEFDWGNINYGIRIEQTEATSSGSLLDGDTGTTTLVSVDTDYTNILPSVHVNVDLQEDLKLRASFSSGVSRPTYEEMRASYDVDFVEGSVSGGNPEIDPEESYGFDLSLEWYYADAALVSGGVFYRSIDNVIYPAGTTIADGSTVIPGVAPGTPVDYDSFFNGDDGELTGIELQALVPLPAGFGVSGNVTFIDSEFTAPLLNETSNLPGTSDFIMNGSIFWENYGLSLRLNYMYRDDWLSLSESDSLNEFWGEQERVDFSARYLVPLEQFDGAVTIFFNANNLTDYREVRYTDTTATPNQYEGYGERWLLGLRVDY